MKKIYSIILIFLGSCQVIKTIPANKSINEGKLVYYLPETILKITHTVNILYQESETGIDKKTIETESEKIEIEKIIKADTETPLLLSYKSNALMNDDIKMSVNSDGLLATVIVKTDDRSSEIIEKVLTGIGTKSKVKSRAANSKNKTFQKSFYVNLDNYGNDFNWEISLDSFIKIPIKFSFSKNKIIEDKKLEVNSFKYSEVSGILTRPQKNISFHFKTDNLDTNSVFFMVIDKTKLINIPIKRTLFSKNSDSLIIEDGIVKSNNFSRTAILEGLIDIPIGIAKAIVGIPAQLIQIKFNSAEKNKDLYNKEVEKLKAELQYKLELERINNKLDSLAKSK